MQSLATLLGLSLLFIFSPLSFGQRATMRSQQTPAIPKHLLAVRGEVVKIKSQGKGMLLLTIKPAKEFSEVTVLARENDLVGKAIGGSGEIDLLGLLADDTRDEETITAAELNEGDVVSIIYNPQLQNRSLEIYLH